jgi:putative tryptophan/tyrosine transport system substrate-binding protein
VRRRDFITLVGGVAAAWPLGVRAQEPGRAYRLGGVSVSPRNAPHWLVTFDELRRLCFIEGQNLTIDWCDYGRRIDLVSEFVTDLVKAHVDVIYVGGDAAMVGRNGLVGSALAVTCYRTRVGSALGVRNGSHVAFAL